MNIFDAGRICELSREGLRKVCEELAGEKAGEFVELARGCARARLPQVIVPIQGRDLVDLRRQVEQLREEVGEGFYGVDVLEWRVDACVFAQLRGKRAGVSESAAGGETTVCETTVTRYSDRARGAAYRGGRERGAGRNGSRNGAEGFGRGACRNAHQNRAEERENTNIFSDEWERLREEISQMYAYLRSLRPAILATVRTENGRASSEFFHEPISWGKIAFAQADAKGETLYEKLIRALIACEAEAIDIEGFAPGAQQLLAEAQDRGIETVVSHHNWNETPTEDAIVGLFSELARISGSGATGANPAHSANTVCKLALTPRSRDDVLRLLRATAYAQAALGQPLISIAMGELGAPSRALGHLFGSRATFAAALAASAPGQLSLAQTQTLLARLHPKGTEKL